MAAIFILNLVGRNVLQICHFPRQKASPNPRARLRTPCVPRTTPLARIVLQIKHMLHRAAPSGMRAIGLFTRTRSVLIGRIKPVLDVVAQIWSAMARLLSAKAPAIANQTSW